jgi:NADH:ubiquinone oxidoreductase subunit 3 (subunit A)
VDGTVSPLVAFAVYLAVAVGLIGLGRLLGGGRRPSAATRAIYASGEAAAPGRAAPGYGPYFGVALFFAVLHLGVLVAASGPATVVGAFYVAGLLLILVALVLG